MPRRRARSVTSKPNYVVEDYQDPPESQVKGYRTVRLPGGHLARVAILKKPGPRGGRTRVTSLWHPKTERKSSNPRVTQALRKTRKPSK